MFRTLALALVATSLTIFQPVAASAASVVARVDLSSQTMTVTHRGKVKYRWKVSTARSGKVTPTGSWSAKWLSRNHRSSRYGGAPMPYSVFYSGNYAVHGTVQTGRLGRPASAGCIRLHPSNAAIFYSMAQREGLRNVRIVVQR
jgi:lipoprotein-anchoring transpeptidase ErfK/SrfK